MILTKISTKKKLFFKNKQKNILYTKINFLKIIKKKMYEKQFTRNLPQILKYFSNIFKMLEKNKSKFNDQQKFFFKTNLISYIINVRLLNSNIIINITDLKGAPLIYCSSGIVNFKGSQKTKQLALINVIKKVSYKSKILKNLHVTVHFKGTKKNRKKVLNELKKIFLIKNIKIFNLAPYNGCRPQKIRRKK